jgi:hypothetical protein
MMNSREKESPRASCPLDPGAYHGYTQIVSASGEWLSVVKETELV